MMREKILKYLKTNRWYLAVMAICAVVFMALMLQAVLYADDYSVGVISAGGVPAILADIPQHYMSWGGGYTPAIVALLLMCPSVVWKLVVVLLMLLIVAMTSRMTCRNKPERRAVVALIMWLLFFSVSVYLLRETIIWLDGSMAYLFSTFQAFLVFYLAYTRLFQGDSKKYDFLLIPFAAFFGGWSSAQSGVISVLIILALVLYRRYIKKEKIPILYWTSLVLSIVGFCIFYFAPGNYVRLESFGYYNSLSFVEKLIFRSSAIFQLLFDGYNTNTMASPFFIHFAIIAVAFLAYKRSYEFRDKKTKRLSLICSIVACLFGLGFMISRLPIPNLESYAYLAYYYKNLLTVEVLSFKFVLGLLPYVWAMAAIIATIVNAWLIARQSKKQPFVLVTFLVSLVANFAMILAPYSPLRTIIYSVFFALATIVYVLDQLIKDKASILPLAIVMLACININMTILFAVIYTAAIYLVKPKEEREYIVEAFVFVFCLAIFAAGNYATIFSNYRTNKFIHEGNIARIEDFADRGNDCDRGEEAEDCTIYFVRPYNSEYMAAPLVGEGWIEDSLRDYFNLPSNVEFKYEEEE